MHGYIGSDFKYINNEFFLNLFRINYLLISDQESKLLKNQNFNRIKEISTQKGKLLLFERKVSNYSIDKKRIITIES